MKKSILTIIVIYLSLRIYAQNSFCGNVEYEITYNLGLETKSNYLLNFNSKESLFEELNVCKSKAEVKRKYKKDNGELKVDVLLGGENTSSQFYYNDKKRFYYMEVFFDQELMVKDPDLYFKWRLSTETKKIGRFLCQKATTHFRGRDYTAWFTPQIPVAFGPWKFRGLSGLILEVYDKDRVLYIVAKSVKLTEKENCKIKVDKSRFKEAMTIPEFLDKKNELIQEDIMRLSSKLPKDVPPLEMKEDCEDCKPRTIEIFEKK